MMTMVSCCTVADRGVGSYLVASGVGVVGVARCSRPAASASSASPTRIDVHVNVVAVAARGTGRLLARLLEGRGRGAPLGRLPPTLLSRHPFSLHLPFPNRRESEDVSRRHVGPADSRGDLGAGVVHQNNTDCCWPARVRRRIHHKLARRGLQRCRDNAFCPRSLLTLPRIHIQRAPYTSRRREVKTTHRHQPAEQDGGARLAVGQGGRD